MGHNKASRSSTQWSEDRAQHGRGGPWQLAQNFRAQLRDAMRRFFTGAASWNLPASCSTKDWLGAAVLVGVALVIWFMGDFHSLHYHDDLIHSLISLYRWTPLSWESDHIGSLLALLVGFIRRPYWNVLAISTLSSLMFVGGLMLWSVLLSDRRITLIESAVWVLLLLPLAADKHRIFDNAAHGSTFGSAFFFSALFIAILKAGSSERLGAARFIGLLCTGFLTVYLSKTVLIPLAVVTVCLGIDRLRTEPRPWSAGMLWTVAAPGACLGIALLLYEAIELSSPIRNDFTLSLSNVSTNLPALLGHWLTREITIPALFAIPVLVFLHRPANRLADFLTGGVLLETLIVSASTWVATNRQSGYYLTDLTFLLVLSLILLADKLTSQAAPPRFYPRILPILASAALLLNSHLWNSFSPTLPLTAMDRSFGALTPALVQADCDLVLSGATMDAWPMMLAANDYYHRSNSIDPRTGETRTLEAITVRASVTESRWRPRLAWPDVTACIRTGDESGMLWALERYAPEEALFFVNPRQIGPITAYSRGNRRLTELRLDFDAPAPGQGWSYREVTPTGESFVWMDSTSSTLHLPLSTDAGRELVFRVLYAMAPDVLQSLRISVNGQLVLIEGPDRFGAPIVLHATLPQHALALNPWETVLTLQIDHTVSPAESISGSIDSRSLGLALDWLIIR